MIHKEIDFNIGITNSSVLTPSTIEKSLIIASFTAVHF